MSKHRISKINQSFVLLVVMLGSSLGGSSSALAAVNADYAGKIKIGVDPRVELISIVFRLGGNPEYNDGTLRPYVKEVCSRSFLVTFILKISASTAKSTSGCKPSSPPSAS